MRDPPSYGGEPHPHDGGEPAIYFWCDLKNNQFTAQLFHSIIALYRDPDAIMNHPLPSGVDDRTFRVNPSTIPAKGTSVTVTIQRIKDT